MNTHVSTHSTALDLALEEGSAKVLCNAIICHFEENNISTDEIIDVGCDGTAVNTCSYVNIFYIG